MRFSSTYSHGIRYFPAHTPGGDTNLIEMMKLIELNFEANKKRTEKRIDDRKIPANVAFIDVSFDISVVLATSFEMEPHIT